MLYGNVYKGRIPQGEGRQVRLDGGALGVGREGRVVPLLADQRLPPHVRRARSALSVWGACLCMSSSRPQLPVRTLTAST